MSFCSTCQHAAKLLTFSTFTHFNIFVFATGVTSVPSGDPKSAMYIVHRAVYISFLFFDFSGLNRGTWPQRSPEYKAMA